MQNNPVQQVISFLNHCILFILHDDSRIDTDSLADLQGNPTCTISDNGEGILPDVLDKIFVPFFTTKTSGSGIGLSLCKQIMTLHAEVSM